MRLDGTNIEQSVFCYDSWLKRTRGHILSLKIVCFQHNCTSIRPLLQPYTHQISFLDITFGNLIGYGIVLDDLPALQELRVDVRNNFNIAAHNILISSLISPLRTLRVLELKGRSYIDYDHIFALDPVWARLSNLILDFYEACAMMRLLRLAPNLSSLKICVLFGYQFGLEPFTHTNIKSLSIINSQIPFRTCSCQALIHPEDAFLDALTLPNLRVLDVGTRSWTGEDLKGVKSGTVGMAINIRALVEEEDWNCGID